ncbi:MAG TPA: glycosyltransferase family 4 protein [Peptococcaceae bacterium]|nr:glycosyltransferase family 4 protein [Peptococcaceae bacterium]
MKILVISHMYPSAQNQAYGIFVHKQVKALKEQGLEVKVVSPVPYAPWPLNILKKKWRSYAAIPHKDTIEGIEVYYPRYLEFPRSILMEYSGSFMYLGCRGLIKRLAAEFPFDLIHAHVALPDGQAASLLKRDYGVPVVVTVHGQDFQSTFHRSKRLRARLTEVLGKVDKIITVSTKLKRMVEDQPYASKIEVINNGINLEDIENIKDINEDINKQSVLATGPLHENSHENSLGNSQESSQNDSLDTTLDSSLGNSLDSSLDSSLDNSFETGSKEIRILSVANLKKTKGLDLNIKALATLSSKYPGLRYYIVGDGEERENLEDLVAKLNFKQKVVFLGKLTHSETMAQMAAADIFSLPSWQEGFGVVYIEAMAQGIPVIGVKGEGIEDVIKHGENGLLVEPCNVEDLTNALDLLLSNPAYASRLAQAGRETVINGFTWTHNARKTKALYQNLLS